MPAKNKAENPEHLAIQAEEIPQKDLNDESGRIKVIVGNYQELSSKIPNYSTRFLYHITLNANKTFALALEDRIEVAAFLPSQNAVLNDIRFDKGDFIEFDRNSGEIEVKNTSDQPLDILLFGGEIYTEPVVAEGPFVMNTQDEIVAAYRDFYAGKYGEIKSRVGTE